MSSASSGLTGRQPHARASSHSLLTGALNANHRVTRRKSVTNPGSNVAALTAAIRDGERSAAMPITHGRRMSKSAAARAAIVGSLPSPPASLPSHKSIVDAKQGLNGSAIDDDPNDASADEGNGKSQKARTRRASDGQPLNKDGKKSNRVEVRCDKCGKGYKHSSCLTKHLWEHTPEWSFTSKLLISKHQQVQLLEAASVLVAMNGIPETSSTTPPDSAKDFPSEGESSSPAASGYSDPAERQSSADTTPPPAGEGLDVIGTSYRNKRFSSGGFSRSYQSAPSAGSFGNGSVPQHSGFGHFRQPSNDFRPPSSGRNATGQDDRDLAAAVELLSCSFGSNNGGSRTVTLPLDAPPVPPLPAQYLDQATPLSSFINSYPSRQPESFTRGEMRRPSEDVRMEGSGESVMDDDDFDMRSRGRSEEEDDGVFGRMEE
ncbi:hypothetical protein EDB81DRAFT_876336 [Dactylonectria macrodidyma]|uniref:C2H2-type domain-containing protein n=1 Tax=Dactylonectria macrodidyma TaxID=307937 RepID=A0A9P9JGI6_9HYPO|nr:hypothetical protein EDB81DRAFT_876336 [Dactylonectria macrodidyma]